MNSLLLTGLAGAFIVGIVALIAASRTFVVTSRHSGSAQEARRAKGFNNRNPRSKRLRFQARSNEKSRHVHAGPRADICGKPTICPSLAGG